jgi:hypothetical protein
MKARRKIGRVLGPPEFPDFVEIKFCNQGFFLLPANAMIGYRTLPSCSYTLATSHLSAVAVIDHGHAD